MNPHAPRLIRNVRYYPGDLIAAILLIPGLWLLGLWYGTAAAMLIGFCANGYAAARRKRG